MTLPVSIRTRMLWVITLLLALFFGIAGALIDRNYVDSSLKAFKDRLNVQLFSLIAVTEETEPDFFQVAYPLQDFRVFEEGSGIYTAFFQNNGNNHWVSPSATGLNSLFIKGLKAGEMRDGVRVMSQAVEVMTLSLGVVWDPERAQQTAYTFGVAQELTSLHADILRFRKVLWGGMATIGALLLIFQGVVLRWGLRPLRRVVAEVEAIKSGGQQRIQQAYPVELVSLTHNINALLESQREHLNRHRHALGDLAHSLKTPLAVMQIAVEGDEDKETLQPLLQEQSSRMRDIIDHQLRRAATAGRMPLSMPIAIEPVVQRIIKGLGKVYHDKPLRFDVKVTSGLRFYGDEGDLYELLGNLLDNACKWCDSDVKLTVSSSKNNKSRIFGLSFCVEDDGPGISDALKGDVTKRGAHQQNAYPGQGIGLTVVQDIVAAFRGSMAIENSPLGGTRVSIILPVPV